MIVSHDSGFLDNVCTDIIHYESRKLVHYRGNLSEFVKASCWPAFFLGCAGKLVGF